MVLATFRLPGEAHCLGLCGLVKDMGFRVQGLWCKVQGLGLRTSGPKAWALGS